MISADFRRNPQADWSQFFSDLNRILEEATGLKEFKAGLAEEEKLRRWVMTVLNPMIAKKVMHTKEIVTFYSYLERILARNKESLEFKADLAEEEKLRRLVRATIAMKAVHPKEMMKKMIGRIKALVAVDWKRASEEKSRRLKAKINSMLAERVKSLLVKEEEARRTNAWFAEREILPSERLRQQQQCEQQWRPLIMVLQAIHDQAIPPPVVMASLACTMADKQGGPESSGYVWTRSGQGGWVRFAEHTRNGL
eukprot:CAMPEP_0185744844 /NCGR_PEP_ID=MMETSP1174-20130828/3065_1 /TAXON_ID=35687 /ORGANISM="Dictyocha speculum, Strain CCMP1381" /LENGTH=252 /DNA_ID=CAMNT_0028418501 /DNA_START=196 /DNA_END=950 /DNA_ORIENTATION=+